MLGKHPIRSVISTAFVFSFFEKGLTIQPRLPLDLQPPYLSLLSAGVTYCHQHAQFLLALFLKAMWSLALQSTDPGRSCRPMVCSFWSGVVLSICREGQNGPNPSLLVSGPVFQIKPLGHLTGSSVLSILPYPSITILAKKPIPKPLCVLCTGLHYSNYKIKVIFFFLQIAALNNVNSMKGSGHSLLLLRLCQGLLVISRKVRNASVSSPNFPFSQTQRLPPTGDQKLQWQTSKAGWQFQNTAFGRPLNTYQYSSFLIFLDTQSISTLCL